MFLVNVNKDEKNARHYDYDFDQYKSYYYNEDKDHHCRLLKIKKKELAKKTLGGNFKLSTVLAVFSLFTQNISLFLIGLNPPANSL